MKTENVSDGLTKLMGSNFNLDNLREAFRNPKLLWWLNKEETQRQLLVVVV